MHEQRRGAKIIFHRERERSQVSLKCERNREQSTNQEEGEVFRKSQGKERKVPVNSYGHERGEGSRKKRGRKVSSPVKDHEKGRLFLNSICSYRSCKEKRERERERLPRKEKTDRRGFTTSVPSIE
jgi:hypothetical protein